MTHTITIRTTGRVIDVHQGETIFTAALRVGIAYPHGCRSGRCGACKTRLIEGEVEMLRHTPFALSERERSEGLILACRAVPQTDGTVLWLDQDEETLAHPHRTLLGRVTDVADATHDIKRIQLAIENGGPFVYSAGQYARVTVPGAPPCDYSVASLPGQDSIEFHVRHVPGGATSTRIVSTLRVGDIVRVEGPFGSSYLRERHTGPIPCVAGGSGLAPIKSIVATAAAGRLRQPIHVYFGARSERNLYLVDWFTSLASMHPNVMFVPVLWEPDAPTERRTGYVSDALAQDLADCDGWKAHVTGPPAMVEATGQALTQRGLRAQDLHADVFFTPELAPAA
jgi:ferredoxin-NAD(P)+ reductase (naphthalene dioxygenase ferredoxin-specific)